MTPARRRVRSYPDCIAELLAALKSKNKCTRQDRILDRFGEANLRRILGA
jgi:hypothetical protein